MSRPKTKIVQFMYGDSAYFPYSEQINRYYCQRHGYEYVLCQKTPRADRHVVWHKIPLILEELRDCDYLLFVDADAVFYSHELAVENELIPELSDKVVLMAQDVMGERDRWNPGKPNSGVILTRNTERAREVFAEWNQASDRDEEVRWNWPPTQLALWRHVMPKFEDDIQIVLDYYVVQGRKGQFIRHFAYYPDEVRTNGIKAVHDRLFAGR